MTYGFGAEGTTMTCVEVVFQVTHACPAAAMTSRPVTMAKNSVYLASRLVPSSALSVKFLMRPFSCWMLLSTISVAAISAAESSRLLSAASRADASWVLLMPSAAPLFLSNSIALSVSSRWACSAFKAALAKAPLSLPGSFCSLAMRRIVSEVER